ncbi:MAG: nucleotidyltransferase family protein [Caulobacter sp.]|nr:nucleotidyltransferase family protein [Caulobacter sp.]
MKTGPLEAIVLAAGAGSRFGGGKLTAPWGEGLLLDAALDAAFAAPVRTVTVVWGADDKVLEAASRRADQVGEAARLHLLHNARHAEGMGASLRTAIGSLPPDTAGAFVFLGDMPRIPHGIARDLAEAMAAGARAAAPVCQGRRGHPALFSAELFPALKALAGDRGAGWLLGAMTHGLTLIPTDDDGVLFDVDEPQADAPRSPGSCQAEPD